MRILVLGGGRFQGRRAAERLRDEHHEVVVLNRSAPPAGTRYVAGDRNDLALLDRVLEEGFDVVIDNLAYRASDVTGLLPLLAGRVGHYVLISSYVIYLPAAGHGFVREEAADLSSRAGSAYDIGKRQCEAALREPGQSVPWTALRFVNLEGPGDPSNRRGFFLDRVRDGHGVLIPSDYGSLYQPLWRDDAAAAVALVAGNRAAHGQAFNVAGDEIYALFDWLLLLAEAAGCPPPLIVSLPYFALRHLAGFEYRIPLPGPPLLDTRRLTALGFRPTPARQWLPETVQWWQAAGLPSRFWETRAEEVAAIGRVRALWS